VSGGPLVSVIIPCFNHGHVLGEAIASAWRSTPRDVEILVVDDGSTDDTAAVAQSFAGVRCVSQPRSGPSRARNRGIAESRGRFMVFLDADDQLAPGALDVGVAELTAHPMAGFVFGRCRLMAPDGAMIPTPERTRIERNHYRELLIHNYVWAPSMAMFRRASVERAGGFNPEAGAAADYGLYLRIARANPIHDHGQVVAFHRVHRGARLSHGSAGRRLQETLSVLRRERGMVESVPALLEAYYQGWRQWQDFYGAHLVDEMRAHGTAREWRGVVWKGVQLGWLHPQAAAHHALRSIVRTVGAIGARPRRRAVTTARR
jgi:glycosyltransferase involved in cell wall biosynthesis